ncbi:extracellular chitosanase [Moniliophthora roreri]|uniref:Endo-chitosanase n=1 Tax=Moniliophthora roreri TaxID=221103 RepID=A0A0W0EV36_MONRR|nr:extracellular chitosanase [Moniliophthora roreri]
MVSRFSFTFITVLAIFSLVVRASPLIERADSIASTFAADASINAVRLWNAVNNSRSMRLASYPWSYGTPADVNIYADWLYITNSSILYFIADMDVDCDGVDYMCPGNSGGDRDTSFGHLDASKVPYYVIPARFYSQYYPKVLPNALGAIICNGKIFYGIMGDTNGANPQMIGEASYLLARTCFPQDNLNGNRGHEARDVAYIIFGNQVPGGVQDQTIDINALKTLGDQQLRMLTRKLGI